MDPFAELGVPKDADKGMIRRARRRKARELHPDRNKDPAAAEAMARCNLAHDILVDPVRRAAWEKTGHIRVDPDDVQARKLIIEGMQSYLMAPVRVNIPKALAFDLDQALVKGANELAKLDKAEADLRARRDELATDDEVNLWQGIVDGQLEGIEAKRTTLHHEIAVTKLAIEIAHRYRSGVMESPLGMGLMFPKVLTARK